MPNTPIAKHQNLWWGALPYLMKFTSSKKWVSSTPQQSLVEHMSLQQSTAGPKPARFHDALRYNVLTEIFGTFASQPEGPNSAQINSVWNSFCIASCRQYSDYVDLRVFSIGHIWSGFDNGPPRLGCFSARLSFKATSGVGTACMVWAEEGGVVWHIGQVWPEPTSLRMEGQAQWYPENFEIWNVWNVLLFCCLTRLYQQHRPTWLIKMDRLTAGLREVYCKWTGWCHHFCIFVCMSCVQWLMTLCVIHLG